MTGEESPPPPPPERPSGDPPDGPRRKRRRRPRKRTGGSNGQTAASKAGDAAPTGGGRRKRRPRRHGAAATSNPDSNAPAKQATPKSAAKSAAKKTAKGRGRGPRIPTHKEVSAGGVVYRRDASGALEILLASRRTRRGELVWGLAKGGVEDGETFEVAAVREVREETGLVAEIEADLGDTKYMYVWEEVRIRKTVHFFLMRHVGGDISDRDDEMEDVRWFPLERALKRAAYRGERDMLARAAELLS